MKKYILLLVLLTGFCLTLSSLGFGRDFEGTWTATGGDQELGWTKTYHFGAGQYQLEGYPPLSETGSYEIILQDENTYTVKMEPDSAAAYVAQFVLKKEGTLEMKSLSASGEGMVFAK